MFVLGGINGHFGHIAGSGIFDENSVGGEDKIKQLDGIELSKGDRPDPICL